jgi:hypothetical protein
LSTNPVRKRASPRALGAVDACVFECCGRAATRALPMDISGHLFKDERAARRAARSSSARSTGY